LLQHLDRRQRHVPQDGHVREEVERLEDDPDLTAYGVPVDALDSDLRAMDPDPSRLDLLQKVDAAQQRRFARSARADQADNLVLVQGQVDPFQDLESVERLVDAFEPDSFAHANPPAIRRLR
jgi:hypothetical protein